MDVLEGATIGLTLATFLLALVAFLQVIATRRERVESIWDVLSEGILVLVGEGKDVEKIRDMDIAERSTLRRKYHLYLERFEEALRLEKPAILFDFWEWKFWKSRHKRIQSMYMRLLSVYGDGAGKDIFDDVKLWHDYSKGDIDPLEVGFRILEYLRGGPKEEERIVRALMDNLNLQINPNHREKVEQGIRERLKDLGDFGFVGSEGGIVGRKRWGLSMEWKGLELA